MVNKFAIVIHGGAGVISRDSIAEVEAEHRAALRAALDRGALVLEDGGTACDAVEAAVCSLEDCELFNAGRGSVFNEAEAHEMEACFANGANGDFGAASLLTTVQNPVSLARCLMDRYHNLYLAGEGAELVARREFSSSLAFQPPAFFSTDKRRAQFHTARRRVLHEPHGATAFVDHSLPTAAPHAVTSSSSSLSAVSSNLLLSPLSSAPPLSCTSSSSSSSSSSTSASALSSSTVAAAPRPLETTAYREAASGSPPSVATSLTAHTERADKFGTVGACALDVYGNVAAGTSTGGLTLKRVGRIGDSPIYGHSTFACNATCAVSTTGIGEQFMRNCTAYDLHARMKYTGCSLAQAADDAFRESLPAECGGVIGIDAVTRDVVMKFNSRGMFRGFATDSQRGVAIWDEP